MKNVKLSTIVIVVAILYLVGNTMSSDGDSGTSKPKNPHPYSTVCNQYFRGGC